MPLRSRKLRWKTWIEQWRVLFERAGDRFICTLPRAQPAPAGGSATYQHNRSGLRCAQRLLACEWLDVAVWQPREAVAATGDKPCHCHLDRADACFLGARERCISDESASVAFGVGECSSEPGGDFAVALEAVERRFGTSDRHYLHAAEREWFVDAHAADRQQHFEFLLGVFGCGRFKRDCVGGKPRNEKQRTNKLCLGEPGSDRTATTALRKVHGAL